MMELRTIVMLKPYRQHSALLFPHLDGTTKCLKGQSEGSSRCLTTLSCDTLKSNAKSYDDSHFQAYYLHVQNTKPKKT